MKTISTQVKKHTTVQGPFCAILHEGHMCDPPLAMLAKDLHLVKGEGRFLLVQGLHFGPRLKQRESLLSRTSKPVFPIS